MGISGVGDQEAYAVGGRPLTTNDFYYKVVDMKITPLGRFEQVVMAAVLRLGTAAYGVSIAQEIRACSNQMVSPGALYTTLERLQRKGLLKSRTGDPTPQRGGRAKNFYSLTEEGQARLRDSHRAFQGLLSGVELFGEIHA